MGCRFLGMLVLSVVLSPLAQAHVECKGKTRTPDSRYQIKGDEVYDTRTKLSWKRCLEGMSWDGRQCHGSPSWMGWDEAVQRYPQTGSGWRMPNRAELTSLRAGSESEQSGCWFPALNEQVFPGGQDKEVWSSLADANHASGAWGVDFFYGNLVSYFRHDNIPVRLVRSGR